MGYYVEAPVLHGKAQYLQDSYDAEIIDPPTAFSPPEGKALMLVVDNGAFEAAGYVHDQREFDAFTYNSADMRPRIWLLMDKVTAELLTGYYRSPGGFPDYTIKDPQSIKAAAEKIKAES
jgi:hypothetical protein